MKKTDAPTPYSRRVATCLNALKGVPDEWLEQYADGKSIKNIVEQSCDLVRKEEELTVALLATEEENAALREALKPFAEYSRRYPSGEITVEHFHAAASALDQTK